MPVNLVGYRYFYPKKCGLMPMLTKAMCHSVRDKVGRQDCSFIASLCSHSFSHTAEGGLIPQR